jgi:hypothetical protein
MPQNSFTPAGDSSFAALLRQGAPWATVTGFNKASSVVDAGTTDIMFQARLQGSTFHCSRGFMYFDLEGTALPSYTKFIKLRKARLTLTVSSKSGSQANAHKFRIFAMDPATAGFNPHINDYVNFHNNVSSADFEVTGTGTLNCDIIGGRLLKWIETKIKRREDLYLMIRNFNDVGGTDPSGNNYAACRSPTYGTPALKPEFTLSYTLRQGRKALGGGFSNGSVKARGTNGFGNF